PPPAPDEGFDDAPVPGPRLPPGGRPDRPRRRVPRYPGPYGPRLARPRRARVLREEGSPHPGGQLLLVPRPEEAERRAAARLRRGTQAGVGHRPGGGPRRPGQEPADPVGEAAGRLPDAAEDAAAPGGGRRPDRVGEDGRPVPGGR